MIWKKKQPAPTGNAADETLEEFYRDAAGNVYYRWKNPAVMPAMRYLIGWQSIQFANMDVDANTALTYLDKIIQANNNGRPSDVGYQATSFKNRILRADPTSAYLELAAVYTLIGEENKEEYSIETTKRKLSLWHGNLKEKAFFLNFAFDVQRNLTATSRDDIPTALTNQINEMAKTFATIQTRLSAPSSTP